LTRAQLSAALLLGGTSVSRFADSSRIVIEDLARQFRLALDRIQLYREAQEANRLKDEFLSTLSHELRTPLNAVFGWARILRLRQLDRQTAHAVEVIERNAEAQLRLIEDVLDVSRIITGKMRLSREPLNIRDVLAATIEAVRPAAEAKGARMNTHLEAGLPPCHADVHRLQQAFSNVLSNALKFTRASDLITVSLRRDSDWAEIQVCDTGVGIRQDVLPFVFDRFRQADSSTTRTHGGLGLGLAIVQHIIELHGGTVKAESPGLGRGATFTIRLPFEGALHQTVTRPGSATVRLSRGAAPAATLRGRTVLVVEDHDDARELVESVLGAAGAEVISTRSTEEALERIAGTTPDLLLADLGLPGEDGYTLLQRVRAMSASATQTMPAVALTAYARSSDRERALAAGFARYVIKPVDPVDLVDVLASVLESR
jgi:signal transduction histidine kinase/CheY-like chemotaxis protein